MGLGGLGEDLGNLGKAVLDPLWELICEPDGVSDHSALSCAVGAWRAQAAPFLLSMAGTGVKTAGNSPPAAPCVQDWPKGLCTGLTQGPPWGWFKFSVRVQLKGRVC